MRQLDRKLRQLEYFRHYEIIRFRDLEYLVSVLLYAVHQCAPPDQAANVDRAVTEIMRKARTGELFAAWEQPK